jgi:hypothetical protein
MARGFLMLGGAPRGEFDYQHWQGRRDSMGRSINADSSGRAQSESSSRQIEVG